MFYWRSARNGTGTIPSGAVRWNCCRVPGKLVLSPCTELPMERAAHCSKQSAPETFSPHLPLTSAPEQRKQTLPSQAQPDHKRRPRCLRRTRRRIRPRPREPSLMLLRHFQPRLQLHVLRHLDLPHTTGARRSQIHLRRPSKLQNQPTTLPRLHARLRDRMGAATRRALRSIQRPYPPERRLRQPHLQRLSLQLGL